ncbi:MAG: methyl-viologen-reducing hydrogenase subunit delta, partial [Dehalococcoidia bacterium]|nr:methyl-viologen-reducing hydrogenase subunit delta [Dehalococcoidia bacterium]
KLEWVSAAEGQRFAQVVTDFISEIKKLGPSPLKGDAHELAKVTHQAEASSVQAHK